MFRPSVYYCKFPIFVSFSSAEIRQIQSHLLLGGNNLFYFRLFNNRWRLFQGLLFLLGVEHIVILVFWAVGFDPILKLRCKYVNFRCVLHHLLNRGLLVLV